MGKRTLSEMCQMLIIFPFKLSLLSSICDKKAVKYKKIKSLFYPISRQAFEQIQPIKRMQHPETFKAMREICNRGNRFSNLGEISQFRKIRKLFNLSVLTLNCKAARNLPFLKKNYDIFLNSSRHCRKPKTLNYFVDQIWL